MLFKSLKRELKRVYVRLIGSKTSIYASSMGVAIGFFFSVAIPLFQVFVAFGVAFLLKANKTLAVVFTFFSNPYTTPFLYTGACLLGARILGYELSINEIKSSFADIYTSFSFASIGKIGWKLFVSYMVGGPLIGLFLALPGYFISSKLIRAYQKRRSLLRTARITLNQNMKK